MLINQQRPTVAVLLATYNGMPWINDQIDSILNQTSIDITMYVSDDMSEDATYTYLLDRAEVSSQLKVLPQKERYGSAGKNFYRLIKDVSTADFDYIAFADQDDHWESDKLIRHILIAQEHQADGVSSNVMAFWPDGKRKLIIKSQQQKKWDFLFESAGPGCTFLMTPWLVNKVKEQLIDKNSPASEVDLHDWLTYAVCRSHGHKWIIDPTPSVQYRQHQSNVIGANSGLKAKLARLEKLKHGWYRSEVVKICHVCTLVLDDTEIKKISSLLANKCITSQIKLLVYISQARRKFSDRLTLYVLILIFLF